jgi:L-2-hydroxycarboxylate dehydrogenase (NAD+)
MEEITLPYSQLWQFAYNVFKKINCSEDQARLATDVLLSADLRGIDSHGVARLSGYIRLWEAKRINSTPNIRIVHETPSTAVVDGDGGLGLVIAPKAMEIAIEKAKIAGTGWVAVKNSNHFGIAGYHAMMALPHDMIGMAMTNASPLVVLPFPQVSNLLLLPTLLPLLPPMVNLKYCNEKIRKLLKAGFRKKTEVFLLTRMN